MPQIAPQSSPRRVVSNVLDDTKQVLLIAHNLIEAFLLPQRSLPTEAFVNLISHVAFPTVKNVFQLIIPARLHDNVAVIRHNAVAKCQVALLLEINAGICHQLRNACFSKDTLAVPSSIHASVRRVISLANWSQSSSERGGGCSRSQGSRQRFSCCSFSCGR